MIKKSVLAVTLLGILSSGTMVQAKEKVDPMLRFEKDYLNISRTVLDPFHLNGERLAIEIDVEKENKKNLLFTVNALMNEKIDPSINASYEQLMVEEGKAKLSAYKENRGKAMIESEKNIFMSIMVDEEVFPLFTLVEPLKFKNKLDNKRKELSSDISMIAQDIVLPIENLLLAYGYELDNPVKDAKLSLGELSSYRDLHFNGDYTEMKRFKQTAQFDGATLDIHNNDGDQFVGSIGNIDYLYEGDLEKNEHKNIVKAEEYQLTLKSLGSMMVKSLLSEMLINRNSDAKDAVDLHFNLDFNDINLASTQMKGEENLFGSLNFKTGLSHIAIEPAKELVMAMVELGNRLNEDDIPEDSEILEVLQGFATIFSDESTLSVEFKGESNSDATFSYQYSIQPSKALLKLIEDPEKNMEALLVQYDEPVQLIDHLLKSLTFTLVVDDQYIVDQYYGAQRLIDADADPKKSEKEVTQFLQMAQYTAGAFAMEGLTLLQREDNARTRFEVSYQDQQWNINGETYSTEELQQLIDDLPF